MYELNDIINNPISTDKVIELRRNKIKLDKNKSNIAIFEFIFFTICSIALFYTFTSNEYSGELTFVYFILSFFFIIIMSKISVFGFHSYFFEDDPFMLIDGKPYMPADGDFTEKKLSISEIHRVSLDPKMKDFYNAILKTGRNPFRLEYKIMLENTRSEYLKTNP